MNVVFAGDRFPNRMAQSIFLVGPTPRSPEVVSWRPEALRLLQEAGFQGVVFVPEDSQGGIRLEKKAQIQWELSALNRADCALVWLPRNMDTLPGLTTNVEVGMLLRTGRLVVGIPPEAQHVGYIKSVTGQKGVPQAGNLQETINLALQKVQRGAERLGGECQVPLHVWHTEDFQKWRETLADTELQCCLRDEKIGKRLFWMMRVEIANGKGEQAKSKMAAKQPDRP